MKRDASASRFVFKDFVNLSFAIRKQLGVYEGA